MASNINPYNVDGTFPVAGQDNSSQGFRDNFTNIKNNFLFAQNEINDLQTKTLVTSALNGQSINNDMAGTEIRRPQLAAWTQTLFDLGAVSTSATLDFNQANFQKLTTAGSVDLGFINWPASTGTGSLGYGLMRVWIKVSDVGHIITLPVSVSVGVNDIAGYNVNDRTITFDSTGDYIFDFSSIDSGNTYLIFDVTRNHATFRDPSFYLNSSQTPTLLIGYGAGITLALQVESGQDRVSSLGSYNSVSVGTLSSANVAYTQTDTGGIAGYSVSSARGNIQLANLQPVLNQDLVGYFNGIVYTGTGSGNTFQQIGSIDFFASGSNYTNGLGGNIAFFTAVDGDTSLNRVAQAVGIENNQSVIMYANATVTGNLTTAGGRVDTGYQYLGAPSTNFWANITTNVSRLIIDPATTLAVGNVTLPNVAVDGTIVSVHSTATITAFGANSLQSGTVVKPNTAVTLSAGTGVEYFYHKVENTWYKIR
jgi:hypothetical protein